MDIRASKECSIIILGASGDLTKRKLIPALYKMLEENQIERCIVLGASIMDIDAAAILAAAKPYIKNLKRDVWKRLKDVFLYQRLDFYSARDFESLKKRIERAEKKVGLSGNRLFYLATMPEHFEQITRMLAEKEIVSREDDSQEGAPWSRVVYEKPFGKDATSAEVINQAIAQVFDERQVYRIDHYLGKELVGNITLLRFTNLFLQPLWNAEYIDSVQIIINEKIGIEDRGAFYDQYGALKDVVQNHMLQLVALVAMESPEKLSGEHIRQAKADVLQKIHLGDVLLGQYEGYHQEKGVAPGSETETFAALSLTVDTPRWKGVPFFLKTGKAMKEKSASIHIKFKQIPCLLLENCPMDSNYLTINIEPDEGFFLEVNAKKPGVAYQVTPVKMEFSHKALFGPNSPAAYEVLLSDALRGDQSVFVRFDEIMYSWKVIEAINSRSLKRYSYSKSSQGPEELVNFSRTLGVAWRA